jgi:hypothetical protein
MLVGLAAIVLCGVAEDGVHTVDEVAEIRRMWSVGQGSGGDNMGDRVGGYGVSDAADAGARRVGQPRVEAVFCRHNEDVSWISRLPKTDFKYAIYNKGGIAHPMNVTGLDATVIDLPNGTVID